MVTLDPIREACDRKLTVTVKIPQWIAKDRDLLSRVMEGTLERVTEKAVYFKGSATIRKSRHCHRCGREITHPASLTVGYGPECSAKLGILWPDGLLTDAEIEKIRETIRRQTLVEIWLPRSRTEIEINPSETNQTETQHRTSGLEADTNGLQGRTDSRPLQVDTNKLQDDTRSAQPDMKTAQVKFEVRGSRIAVNCPFALKDRCKEVPGYAWDAQNKLWTFPATGVAANGLIAAFKGVATVKDNAFLKLLQDEAKTSKAEATKMREDLPEIPNSKTKAWGHQKQAFWYTAQLWGGLPD